MRFAFLALPSRATFGALTAVAAFACGCASQDIPQAYKGRMFDRTGPLALFFGGNGFTGPVLGPGSYFTGTYDELRMVDCAMVTKREALTALTKDGVQFGLDIYVRFAADCRDRSVEILLATLTPDRDYAITSNKVYETFVRPAIGEAVREVVSPYRANEINDKREEILASIRKRFVEIMTAREKQIVVVYEVNLSNLDFPDAMDTANTDRAVQSILRDKAIAERERVQAETETMQARRQLAEREGEMEAARIDRIGEALRKNPEFLQFDLQSKMPEIYRVAGANGNLIVAAPTPTLTLSPPRLARPVAPVPVRTEETPRTP
jgi:regulator of protease activity HflC (stomatin/prohibitin superfamily)